MLVFRYLFKETTKTQLAVLFVLLLIFVSQKFVRVLAQAAEGALPADLVVNIMLLNLPSFGMLILPISLFVGILLAHGRLYAESEMTVLFACGYSKLQVLRDTLVLSLLSMFIAGGITLWLTPYSNGIEQALLDEVDASVGISALNPGRFEVLTGNAVVYVEQIEDKGKTLAKVFVAHSPKTDDGRPSVVIAQGGGINAQKDGSQWLKLTQGQRYEGELDQLDFQILNFESYQVLIKERKAEDKKLRLYAMPTKALIGSNDLEFVSELQWRLALPLSIPLLTLIVVPLSSVNPRQGRFSKLLPAISIYLSFYLLLSSSRSALESGTLPPHIGLWGVLAGAFLVGIWLNFSGSGHYLALRNRLLTHKKNKRSSSLEDS